METRLLARMLVGGCLVGDEALEAALEAGLAMELSLDPGRMVMLNEDPGLEGGRIGLCDGKKLDLLRSVTGVGGSREMLSMVLSDRLRRDDFRPMGVVCSGTA